MWHPQQRGVRRYKCRDVCIPASAGMTHLLSFLPKASLPEAFLPKESLPKAGLP